MRETDPTDDAAIGFTVGTVAQVLDIPVATLRSWNRRYGLGPPHRNPGEHRYYTPSDVAVLGPAPPARTMSCRWKYCGPR
ncbi:MerR family transcriptional regulator [Nocardia fusca]|uniref:MerR family transcriptional regulator n=1 Tax=Nocardia fusca TaxID=941183 RepID=UPI0007A73384|nr:MerR family transcriptional regulator [Nocardia fusca]